MTSPIIMDRCGFYDWGNHACTNGLTSLDDFLNGPHVYNNKMYGLNYRKNGILNDPDPNANQWITPRARAAWNRIKFGFVQWIDSFIIGEHKPDDLTYKTWSQFSTTIARQMQISDLWSQIYSELQVSFCDAEGTVNKYNNKIPGAASSQRDALFSAKQLNPTKKLIYEAVCTGLRPADIAEKIEFLKQTPFDAIIFLGGKPTDIDSTQQIGFNVMTNLKMNLDKLREIFNPLDNVDSGAMKWLMHINTSTIQFEYAPLGYIPTDWLDTSKLQQQVDNWGTLGRAHREFGIYGCFFDTELNSPYWTYSFQVNKDKYSLQQYQEATYKAAIKMGKAYFDENPHSLMDFGQPFSLTGHEGGYDLMGSFVAGWLVASTKV